MIEKGADVNQDDKRGMTPLFEAVLNGNLKLLACSNQCHCIQFINVIHSDHEEVAELLIKRGAIIDLADVVGLTAVHMAVVKGNS